MASIRRGGKERASFLAQRRHPPVQQIFSAFPYAENLRVSACTVVFFQVTKFGDLDRLLECKPSIHPENVIVIDLEVIHRLQQTLIARKGAAPDSSYVASLYAKGTDAICKKIAEEAAETIMAAKEGDRLHLVREVTDLWFHSMVLLSHFDLGVDDVMVEFRRREGISGIDEKRNRGENA